MSKLPNPITPGFYRTRNGEKAEVTEIIKNPVYPVIGECSGLSRCWTADGHWWEKGDQDDHDLIALWEENPQPDELVRIRELEARLQAQVELTAEFDVRIGELQDENEKLKADLWHFEKHLVGANKGAERNNKLAHLTVKKYLAMEDELIRLREENVVLREDIDRYVRAHE